MGCMEAKEGIPDVDEEAEQASRAAAAAKRGQRKRKKKLSLRKKPVQQNKGSDVEKSGLASRTESAKVTVIWRRWSIFSSTHDYFSKHVEGETAGPSGRVAETPQSGSASAESLGGPLDRKVS